MRLSKLNTAEAVNFARIEGDDAERVDPLIDAAKSYVLSYTGLTEEEADEHPDLTVAALALITDMYEHRDMHAENASENRTVKTILGMYCRNMIEGD